MKLIPNMLKFYCIIILLGCIVSTAHGFIHLVAYSVVNFLFNKYLSFLMDPVTDFFIGGPTKIVSKTLFKLTPFLNASPMGERLDSIFLNFGLGAIGLIANLAMGISEQSISYSIDGFTTGIGAAISVITGLMDFFFRKIELHGIVASIDTHNKLTGNKVAARRGRKDREFFSGRHLNSPRHEDTFSPSSFNDIWTDSLASDLLQKFPQLQYFLSLLYEGEEDCLKELLCRIETVRGEEVSVEEKELEDEFGPLLSPTALANGTSMTTQECSTHYPRCSNQSLFRYIYIFVQRLKKFKLPI